MRSSRLTAPLRLGTGSYPLADLDPAVKAIIVMAITTAWAELSAQVVADGGSLLAEDENTLTTRLIERLNQIQDEPGHPSGFSASQFQSVTRDAKLCSFDQRSLDKQPDLTFRLVEARPGISRSLRALFTECKIVGKGRPVDLYCERGLRRFIDGDYAWSMPSALMIAYAEASFTVQDNLTPHLERYGSASPYFTQRSPEFAGMEGSAAHESQHGRPWVFPVTRLPPGDIRLLHLWLPR